MEFNSEGFFHQRVKHTKNVCKQIVLPNLRKFEDDKVYENKKSMKAWSCYFTRNPSENFQKSNELYYTVVYLVKPYILLGVVENFFSEVTVVCAYV